MPQLTDITEIPQTWALVAACHALLLADARFTQFLSSSEITAEDALCRYDFEETDAGGLWRQACVRVPTNPFGEEAAPNARRSVALRFHARVTAEDLPRFDARRDLATLHERAHDVLTGARPALESGTLTQPLLRETDPGEPGYTAGAGAHGALQSGCTYRAIIDPA